MIGALLGTQDGRNIEIFNSFELQFDLFDDGQIVINMEYYKTKEEQCKFVILCFRKLMLNEIKVQCIGNYGDLKGCCY